MLILLRLSTQNRLFGNENKTNDHTQPFFEMKNNILPTCLQGNYRDSLGEFSNMLYGMLGLRGLKFVHYYNCTVGLK